MYIYAYIYIHVNIYMYICIYMYMVYRCVYISVSFFLCTGSPAAPGRAGRSNATHAEEGLRLALVSDDYDQLPGELIC